MDIFFFYTTNFWGQLNPHFAGHVPQSLVRINVLLDAKPVITIY